MSDEPNGYCLVGNIVESHEFGEEHETKRGTKHFSPGAKVHYVIHSDGEMEHVTVLGRSRGGRMIEIVMPRKRITNWRVKAHYGPVGKLERAIWPQETMQATLERIKWLDHIGDVNEMGGGVSNEKAQEAIRGQHTS